MKTKIISTALAMTALACAQGAAAQQACVEAADVSDAVVYAMPMLYDGMQTSCANEFAASAFMTNDADSFIAQFAARQDAAWPGTLRLIKVFMAANAAKEGKGEDPMMAALGQMPPEALRPLVDVFVGQMIKDDLTKDLKPSTCSDIAEAMELLAPLPPENISGLASLFVRLAKVDNPPICSTQNAVQAA